MRTITVEKMFCWVCMSYTKHTVKAKGDYENCKCARCGNVRSVRVR